MNFEDDIAAALARQPDDLLNAVARAMISDGCCGESDDDGRCCLTSSAREIFAAIYVQTGLTLDQLEALAAEHKRKDVAE